MSKRLLIVIILTILLVGGTAAYFIFNSPQENTEDTTTNTTPIPMINIENAIIEGFKEFDFPYSQGGMTIEKVTYYKQEWVASNVILLNEPNESNARYMMYVFKRTDGGDKLKLVAFSGDGLTKDSFPDDTPEDVISEMISRW